MGSILPIPKPFPPPAKKNQDARQEIVELLKATIEESTSRWNHREEDHRQIIASGSSSIR